MKYDRVPKRGHHRISAVMSIDLMESSALGQGAEAFAKRSEGIFAYLNLDRLQPHYAAASRQLPRVIQRMAFSAGTLRFTSQSVPDDLSGWIWLIALPHGDLVLLTTVDVRCEPRELIPVLEDLHHRRVKFQEKDFWKGVSSALGSLNEPLKYRLGDHTYQIVFLSELEGSHEESSERELGSNIVSSLIYRYYRPDYSHETLRVLYPKESNRGTSLAATGPYVGVMKGAQDYIENAALISAIQFLGSTALLQRIRIEAFNEMEKVRELPSSGASRAQRQNRRAALIETSRRLSNLSLELGFGVEAFARIGSLVPSLRAVDFHQALYASAELPEEARTLSQMIERLHRALKSEITQLAADERSADERRSLVGAVALGTLTAVALPLGVFFGFFGINATEVDPTRSLWDVEAYGVFYAFMGLFILGAGAIVGSMAWRMWKGNRRSNEAPIEREPEF